MSDQPLINKLSHLGYSPSEEDGFDAHETLAEVVRAGVANYWEGFAVLFANAAKEPAFDYIKVKNLLTTDEERKNYQDLILSALAVYRINKFKAPWIKALEATLSPDDKTALQAVSNSVAAGQDFTIGSHTLSSLRIQKSFSFFLAREIQDKRKIEEQEQETALELALSEVFSTRQKELVHKKLNQQPLTKTEREYFSRVIRKKLVALANADLHRMSKKILGKLYGFILFAFFASVTLFSTQALAAKDFNVKNDTQSFMFVSGTTGNVGVNTTAPRAKLEVDGTIYGNNIGVNSTTPGGLLDIKTDGTSIPFAVSNTATGSYMVITSSGNVGIGTASPTRQKLELWNGNILLSSNYYIDWASGSARVVSGTDADSNRYLGFNTWNASTGISEKVRITGLGNVGIGSTAPVAKLDVTGGSARVWTGAGTVDYATNSGDMYVQGNLEIDGNVYLGDAITDNLTVAGNLTLGGNTTYTGAVTISTTNTAAFLVQNSTGTSKVLTVDTQNGNVGVGTSNPLGTVDVRGSILVPSGILNNASRPAVGTSRIAGEIAGVGGAGTVTPQLSADDGFLRLSAGGGSNSNTKTFIDLSGFSSVNDMNSNIVLGAAGAEKMRITSMGNVGVGTTAPASKLDVFGGITVSDDSGNGDLRLYYRRATYPTLYGDIQHSGNASGLAIKVLGNQSGSGNLTLWTGDSGGSTEKMRITWDGNVGINTTVPRTKLEVDGTIYGMNIGVNTIAPAATLEVERVGTTAPFMVSTATNDGDLLVVTSSGNIGIGTAVPSYLMDVRGSIQSYNSSTSGGLVGFASQRTVLGGGLLSGGAVGYNNDSTTVFWSGSGFPLRLGIGGTEYMRMNTAGNIGIGSVAPAAKLDVYSGAARVWTGAGTVNYATNSGDMYVQGNLEVDGNVYLGDAIADTLTVAGNLTLGGTTSYTGAVSVSTTSASAFAVKTTGGASTIFNVDTSGSNISLVGNVGINTTVPLANLEVVKTSTTDPLRISSSSGGAGDYVIVTSSGNVGIGTLSPSKKLTVNGDALFSSGGKMLFTGNNNIGRVLLRDVNDNNIIDILNSSENRIWGYTNVDFAFGTNNTEKMRITSAGNVGINTTAPRAKLEVDGTIYGNNIGVNSTTPGGLLDIKTDGSSKPFVVSNAATGDYMVVTSSGNVGIGTTNPAGLLQLAKSDVQTILSLQRNGVGAWNTSISNGAYTSNDLTVVPTVAASTYSFMDSSSNSVLMIKASTRNVGIGSSAPTARLDVNGGAARVWTGAGTVNYATNSGDMYVQGNLEIDGNVYLGDAITDNLTVAGNLTLGGTTSYTGAVSVSTTNSSAFSVKTTGGASTIFNVDTSGSNISLVGNVGINTTVPLANLEVVKTGTTAPLKISSAAGGAGNYLVVTSSGSVGMGTVSPDNRRLDVNGKTQIRDALYLSNATGNFATLVVSESSGKLDFQTVNSFDFMTYTGGAYRSKMVLDLDGNLGINSTAPRAKLEVDGTIYGMNIGVNTIAPAATLEIERSGTTAPFMISTATNDGDLLVVTSSGNVGVGTISPNNKLEILGDVSLGSNVMKFGTSGAEDVGISRYSAGRLVVGNGTAGSYLGMLMSSSIGANHLSSLSAGNALLLEIGGVEKMRIDTNGNLGISSAVPSAKLDVTGGAARIWTGAGTVNYATNSGDMYVQGNLEIDGNVYLGDAITDNLTVAGNLTLGGTTSYTGAVSVSTTSANAFSVKTTGGASTIFNVDTSGSNISLVGNIGINTTVPLANLEVVKGGTTAPLKISSTAGGAGDYVVVSSSGNVGIGTISPSKKLDVAGDIRLTGVVYQNAGDLAEKMPLSLAAIKGTMRPEPGDVIAISPQGGVEKAVGIGSTMVVGVFSTEPAHLLKNNMENAAPVALSGVVKCKVTNQNGRVKPGDLLIASDVPGRATKAWAQVPPGAVIGKALQAQQADNDVIDIIVMLR